MDLCLAQSRDWLAIIGLTLLRTQSDDFGLEKSLITCSVISVGIDLCIYRTLRKKIKIGRYADIH